MKDEPRTACVARDTCAFDRSCEAFIRCVDVDPIGWAGALRVTITSRGVTCSDHDCDCPAGTVILPAGEYPFSDALGAVREHVERYR